MVVPHGALAGRYSLRRLMLWLDVKLGYGKRLAPRDWWMSSPEVR